MKLTKIKGRLEQLKKEHTRPINARTGYEEAVSKGAIKGIADLSKLVLALTEKVEELENELEAKNER